MNPFFFGRSQRPLFGIHHAPPGAALPSGVVLCPPIGQEYMRTHRALRQLAMQLNRAGMHALRFDYAGVGDSSGDDLEATIEGWLEDVGTAIDELKDSAGVGRVSLVGIRLGAALAWLAGRRRDDIEQIVLWDPVVRGRDYLAELVAVSEPQALVQQALARGDTIGLGGFAMTAALRGQIEAIDLCDGEVAKAASFVVVSEERDEHARLCAHLDVPGGRARYACIPGTSSWVDAEQMGAVLLPQAIIQAIVASLAQDRR